mmetsp:Transcript_2232/g.6017  ORF Transcript_2232/g.6017 Transcript_2232/m.6017 type:complete len:207 (+) Transcript_2232:896-1516(+)
MRISVEESKLEELSHTGHDTRTYECIPVKFTADRLWVCAAYSVDPLHNDHIPSRQVAVADGYFDGGIVREVASKVLDVSSFLRVVELFEELFPKLVDDESRGNAERCDCVRVDEPRERTEQEEVAEYDWLHARTLHLDGHLLSASSQPRAVHLPDGRRSHRPVAHRLEHFVDWPPEIFFDDGERDVVWEGGNVILEDSHLRHEVCA